MNTFSCKIVLADYKKANDERMIYLQAIIDRIPVRIPMGFYIQEEFFDRKHGRIKATHKNSETFNEELEDAKIKANQVASTIRKKWKTITPTLFRNEFTDPEGEIDFVKFITRELDLCTPDLAPNTVKQHQTVINKLGEFQKVIRFGELCPDLLQKFKNFLIKKELKPQTVDKLLKIVKQYCLKARKKGHEFEDPFKLIRIKNFRSNRVALSEKELARMEEYYEKSDTKKNHKRLLQYFLFSCYTGLRISDVGEITWDNISDDLLSYIPKKTKKKDEIVVVPITQEKKYLPAFRKGNIPIFRTFSDPVSNRLLKDIAGKVDIKKSVTFHTARHTFCTLMAEGGFLPETQKMAGHGNIKTTMGYVHTSVTALIEAKKKRFSTVNQASSPEAPEEIKHPPHL